MASSTSSALWRLYRAPYGPGLDGIGGTFANGRWHKRGELVVYFGASASIVVLERLAHIDADLLPGDLRLGRFEFAASVSINNVNDLAALPDDWTRNETFTRNLGSEWLRTPSACVLAV
ncbi:MAG: RES domain-containing protein, partial [Bryobacteraceae bacterium]